MTKTEWAVNLLNDKYFKEVFQELEAMQLQRFANSSEGDMQDREAAYIKLCAIRDIYNHIDSLAKNVEIAKARWKIW